MISSRPADLDRAVSLLQQGGVIAYPTEAVWGLGCDPWNGKAVERLLALKGRPADKGLILVAAHEHQVAPLLEGLSPRQRQRLQADWPGMMTFVIPDPDGWAPPWIRGAHQSVAVRVSAHPVVQSLCLRWGRPLVSTSANKSGAPPCTRRDSVVQQLGDSLDLIIQGQAGPYATPSPILDLASGHLLRAGSPSESGPGGQRS
ncbi:MAG: L-threonylcarbamoyladenylate synthase [Kistimonas sp.]|nr:L-threonylcarbamoyladenylate synthase [Kistimonas sp.]